MSLIKKFNMMRECSGKTFDEFATHFGCSRQNVHQMMNRRFNTKNALDVIDFCGFKLKIYPPSKDVVITITTQDRLEDEKP